MPPIDFLAEENQPVKRKRKDNLVDFNAKFAPEEKEWLKQQKPGTLRRLLQREIKEDATASALTIPWVEMSDQMVMVSGLIQSRQFGAIFSRLSKIHLSYLEMKKILIDSMLPPVEEQNEKQETDSHPGDGGEVTTSEATGD